MRKLLLFLLILAVTCVAAIAIWFHRIPERYWNERHGTLAAITHVELSAGAHPALQNLRAISTSGLEVEVSYGLQDGTQEVSDEQPGILLLVQGNQSAQDALLGLLETGEDHTGWIAAAMTSPLRDCPKRTLARRLAAQDFAPSVSLALDALSERLQAPAKDLGPVLLLVQGETARVGATALYFDERIHSAHVAHPSAGDSWDAWLIGGGGLATKRFEREFFERGARFEQGDVAGASIRALRALTELASPATGD